MTGHETILTCSFARKACFDRSIMHKTRRHLPQTLTLSDLEWGRDINVRYSEHAQVPVLIAVDRYNALFIESEYGQTISDKARRRIPAAELRLAKAMRLLEREPMANGIHLAAPARHDRISQRVPVCSPAMCL